METEQKDAAPQQVEEVIKKKRTRKTNVNFSAQTAGMKTEQLTVYCILFAVWQYPTNVKIACCARRMQPAGCLGAQDASKHQQTCAA